MLRLVPLTYRQATAYVALLHRHHNQPVGYRYAVGVADGPTIHGVAIAGRPVARHLDDGHTIEVTRVATDGTPNACSMLYGACWRAARALGYTRAVTYTQDGETGASLRAAGWLPEALLAARPGWNTPSRHRGQLGTEHIGRIRWGILAADHASAPLPRLAPPPCTPTPVALRGGLMTPCPAPGGEVLRPIPPRSTVRYRITRPGLLPRYHIEVEMTVIADYTRYGSNHHHGDLWTRRIRTVWGYRRAIAHTERLETDDTRWRRTLTRRDPLLRAMDRS